MELKKSKDKLQEELNSVYKEKAKLAEEYMASSKQLQIVRENFEQHDRMLTERENTIKELKAGKKDLVTQLAHLREAHEETVKELQVRPWLLALLSCVSNVECCERDKDTRHSLRKG